MRCTREQTLYRFVLGDDWAELFLSFDDLYGDEGGIGWADH